MQKTATGIARAIDRIGGQHELARRIGVSQQAVHQWYSLGYVPPKRIPIISKITGINRIDLLNPRLRAIALYKGR